MSESHEIQELPPLPAGYGRQRVLRELSADPAKQYQLWLLLKHVCDNDLAPEGVDKNMIGNLALNLEPVSAADFKAISLAEIKAQYEGMAELGYTHPLLTK